MKNTSEFIKELYDGFSSASSPDRVSDLDTREAEQIQNIFSGLRREEMTYQQAASLIVDSALISDQALCYFLPRVAQAALIEGGNYFMLLQRLQRLNAEALDGRQKSLLALLLAYLKNQGDLLDEAEREEIDAGQNKWRNRMLKSTNINDQLLVAIADGNATQAEHLLALGADASAPDYNNNTAISIAIMYGRDDMITMIESSLGKPPIKRRD